MPLTGLSLSEETPAAPAGEEIRPTPPTAGVVTFALIAVNVLVFLIMVVAGVPFVSPGALQVLPWGADFGPLTTSGQWWRLLTSCFLHFGIIHIAMNMYILFQVGILTEVLYGRARYLAMYLMAGIGGNIAGLYVHPNSVAAGASGAIFGVYGGLLAFVAVRRGVLSGSATASIVKSAGIFIVFNFIYGASSAGTDLVAHIGGLVTGFIVGCAFTWSRVPVPATRQMRTWTAALASSLALFTAILFLPRASAGEVQWEREVSSSPSVTVGDHDRVIYTGTATQSDAERAAQALVKTGFLSKPYIDVVLHKDSSGSSIAFQLQGDETRPPTFDDFTSKLVNGQTVVEHHIVAQRPFPWADPAYIRSMKIIGPQLAAAVGGQPFSIRLLNSKGELRNEVRIDTSDLIVGTRDHIIYSGEATAAQAAALGSALQTAGFFQDRGTIVLFDKSGGKTQVSLDIKKSSWDNPKIATAFQTIGHKIAPAVGGLPLTIRLFDDDATDGKDILVQ